VVEVVDTQADEQLLAVAQEVMAGFELVVESLDVRSRSGRTEVDLVVDLPEDRIGSADIDTVADASRELSARLDADDSLLGPGASVLEVGTPGAERALTEPRHFRRARTRLLELTLADGTSHRARLLEVGDDDVLELRHEPGKDSRGRPRRLPPGTPEHFRVPVDEVDHARVQLEFSPPAIDDSES
jgi:ribosome maturation factor RimP